MCIPVHPRLNKLLFAKNQINGGVFVVVAYFRFEYSINMKFLTELQVH